MSKNRNLLLTLAILSLSLIVLTPIAGNVLSYSNNTSFLSNIILAAGDTPGSIPTGQTWTYNATFRNATYSGFFTYTQVNNGPVTIIDKNGSTQQCYNFLTEIDLLKLCQALGISLGTPFLDASEMTLKVWDYINTTNYSIPRMDSLIYVRYTNGTNFQAFVTLLFNVTVNLYQFPLQNGLSWKNVAQAYASYWIVNASGYNYTYETSWGFNVTASVSGPASVTVPAGTYQAYQINYTEPEVAVLLFGWLGELVGMCDFMYTCYSLEAQNFVKLFMDYGSYGNVTIELTSVSNPIQNLMLFSFFYFFNAQQQQQGLYRLLLIGGGVGAAIIIVGIALLLRRRG